MSLTVYASLLVSSFPLPVTLKKMNIYSKLVSERRVQMSASASACVCLFVRARVGGCDPVAAVCERGCVISQILQRRRTHGGSGGNDVGARGVSLIYTHPCQASVSLRHTPLPPTPRSPHPPLHPRTHTDTHPLLLRFDRILITSTFWQRGVFLLFHPLLSLRPLHPSAPSRSFSFAHSPSPSSLHSSQLGNQRERKHK